MEDYFEALVLSGGGIRGIGQLGPIKYHINRGKLDSKRIKIFAGTSAGTIVNLLIFLGYTCDEIFNKACEISEYFNLQRILLNFELCKFTEKMGLSSLNHLIEKLEEMCIEKIGYVPTLLQIKEKFGVEFIVSVTNNTLLRGEYFSYNTTPRLRVTDAIKVSCSLPLIFEKLTYKGCIYSDGGTTDNWPISVVDTSKYKTLGIITGGIYKLPDTVSENIRYIYSLIVLPIISNTKSQMRRSDPNLTLVYLDYSDTSPISFTLNAKQKKKMYSQAYKEAKRVDLSVKLHVKGWIWEDPLEPSPSEDKIWNSSWDVEDVEDVPAV